MKTTLLLFVAGWLGALAASAAVVKKFDFNVEGRFPSEEPDITFFNSAGFPESDLFEVSGGLLRQSTLTVAGSARYHYPNNQVIGGELDANLDVVMEARVLVRDIAERRGAFFEAFDGAYEYSAQFTNGGVVVRTAEGGFTPVYPMSPGEFHLCRLESRAGGGLVRFFLDGVQKFEGLAPVETNKNGFCWGDGTVTAGANADWDFIGVTNRVPASPRVVDVRTHCGSDSVTVTFNKPVALDGNYALDQGATALTRRHGATPAQVILTTTPLTPRVSYALVVRDVSDLDGGANRVEPNPTRWFVGCASGCGELTSRPGVGGSVVIEWNDAADVLETSADLLAWREVPLASSPWVVAPPQAAQFFRLRCEDGGARGGPEPAFIRHPEFYTVPAGTTVTFHGAAVGAAPLSYQWRWSGTNIAGATGQTLTLTSVSNALEGAYELIATNAFGVAVSRPGYLAITPYRRDKEWNTAVARPTAEVLLIRPNRTQPFNTVVAPPAAELMLLGFFNDAGLARNTTVASPTAEVNLLGEFNDGGLPRNTTAGQPTASVLLLGADNAGLPLNNTIARPPVEVRFQ